MITQKISSLQELLEVLPRCSGKEFVEIARDMTLDPADFEPYSFWRKGFYTRNCIARSDKYELLLLCWEEDQKTPIHCHNNQECWVYMLQGQVHEVRYDLDEDKQTLTPTKEAYMTEGGYSYMNDDMGFHSLQNENNGRSMSLHLYMNPIDECRIMNEDNGKIIRKKLQYHSFEGKPLGPLMDN